MGSCSSATLRWGIIGTGTRGAYTHIPVIKNAPESQIVALCDVSEQRLASAAAKIDPDCALAYWGMAMANANNPKRARSFLKETRKHIRGISRRETLYIEALEALLAETGTPKSGPKGSPRITVASAARAAARASSAVTVMKAFSTGCARSMRARTISTSSTGESARVATAGRAQRPR